MSPQPTALHRVERVVVVKVEAATGVAAEVAEADAVEGATAVTTGAKVGRIESKRPEHIIKEAVVTSD
jgi:hypothetical protein